MSMLTGEVTLSINGELVVVDGDDFSWVDGGDVRSQDGEPFVTSYILKAWVSTDTADDIELTILVEDDGTIGRPKITDRCNSETVVVEEYELTSSLGNQRDFE